MQQEGFEDAGRRVLSRDDPDHLGFKTMIDAFDDFVCDAIEKEFGSQIDDDLLFSYVSRIHDHTMGQLSKVLWSQQRQVSSEDLNYRSQVMIFDWIEPKHLNLPDAAKTANYPMWGVVVRLIRQIE